MKKLILVMFVFLLTLFIYHSSVMARDAITVKLPKVSVTSNYNNSDNFYVSLERLDSSSPMPSTGSVSTVMITGNSDSLLGSITYTKNGDYEYRIYQDKKNLSNVTYDNTVYYLTVQIRNNKAATFLKKSGLSEKERIVEFTNSYKTVPPTPDPDPTPTPDPTPDPDPTTPKKTPSGKTAVSTSNPYTADTIAKYFIISIIAILLILIIIIYVKNSKSDD